MTMPATVVEVVVVVSQLWFVVAVLGGMETQLELRFDEWSVRIL